MTITADSTILTADQTFWTADGYEAIYKNIVTDYGAVAGADCRQAFRDFNDFAPPLTKLYDILEEKSR